MNRGFFIAAILSLVLLLPGAVRADESKADESQKVDQQQLQARAAVVMPAARELRWLKIPWMLNLKEAQETATSERRPIFVWVTGDDPLERC